MDKKEQPTTMDKVRDAILGTDGRGSLYRWLRQHHDEFADLLKQVPRPDWQKITRALSAENLLDASGNKPTPERVRQTWVKVRKDVEASRHKQAVRSRTPPAAQPAAVAPPVRLLGEEHPAEPKPAFNVDKFLKEMDRPWEK